MKKIIIATDYSAEANNAANYAAALAAEKGYQLVLFNLHNISIHALNARISGTAMDNMLQIYQENLNNAATALGTAYKVQVVPHFATGNFYEELVRCIDEHKADMLIMGMAQKTIEQDLLGNTTTSTIHQLPFPIMAIPLTAQYHSFKKILFACDLSRGVEEKVLQNIRSLAADFGATIEVFHVKTRIAEIQQELVQDEHDPAFDETLAGISYYYKNIQSPQIIRAIQAEIQAIDADLLIMVPYKYGFWSSIVHRSKTRMMASGNSIPLLSLPL